jgi:NAD(P)H-dependent flavin oxidoreductase YrpB (nitropropane dioxygenase family)
MSYLGNRFTQAYNTQYPFVNAAMAFVGSSHHLPSAVMKAGAMGTLAVGILQPESMLREIEQIRSEIDGVLNVNLIVPFANEEHITFLCKARPEVVSFHWGPIPEDWIKHLQACGIKVWEQIGSAAGAVRASESGVDAVIAQGLEAGGHNLSTLPTFVLIPEVVAAVSPLMVIAGGGIVSGAQVAAALALGADAVWVGSRFIASLEAQAHETYKQKVITASSGQVTVLTHIYGRESPQFNPLRVLANPITNRWHNEAALSGVAEAEPIILGHMEVAGQRLVLDQFSSFPPTAQATGRIDEMALACGQGVALINQVLSATDIVHELMAGAQQRLRELNQSFS